MADKPVLPLSISLSSDIEPRQGVVDVHHASLQRRHFGNGAGARGEHDRPRVAQVLVGLHHLPAFGLPHRCHGGVRSHRRRRLLGVARDQLHDVGSREVAVRVVAALGVTR